MKRELAKKSLLLVLLLSLIGCFFAACGEKADNEIKLSAWLDRYDEKTITLENGNASDYEWQSADETIVTVENLKLVAKSEGQTTVTGTKTGEKVIIDVTVNDSGAVPRASLDEVVAYAGAQTTVTPKLTYNGAAVEANVEYTYKIKDESVATVSGNVVTGVSVGNTEITARGTYKGVELSAKATLVVKPYNFIEISENDKDITLYNAKNSPLSYREISVTVVKKGEEIKNPELEIVPETQGIVAYYEGKIVAVGEGTTKVFVNCGDLTDELTVTVLPNYIEETFNNTVSAAFGTTYEAYTGEVGGRTEGLFRYVTTNTNIEGQNYWQQRIVNTQSSQKCIDLYKDKGYRYFAFDMYVTKPANMLAPIGGTTDAVYIYGDRYFDVDGIKMIADGRITNKLEANKWITVVYDMRQRVLIDPAANADFYLALHESELTTYLSNIRYYLDDAFIPEEGAVSYEKKDGYVQASNGEFALYRGADESRMTVEKSEVAGVKNAVKLTGNDSEFEQNALVIASSTGRDRSDSLVNLQEKGKYLTFDLYVKKADSIRLSIDYGKTVQNVLLNKTDFERVSWLSLISGDKQLHVLKPQTWITVSVEYTKMLGALNVVSNDPVAILIGTVKAGDEILVNNARYYETDAHIPAEFADKAPAYITASKNSVITTSGEIDLSFVIENGEAGQVPVIVSDSEAVVVGENGKLTAAKTGFANVTATFGDLEAVTVPVRVIPSNEYKLNNTPYIEYPDNGSSFVATYVATFAPDSPEYQTATALKVKFKFNENVNFLHVLTAPNWGLQSDGVEIGDGVYQGFKSWNNQEVATNGFGAAKLTVLNENGEVLGALNQEGIKWETDVTYTLIINLASNEKVYFFTSDNIKAIEEYWWGNGGLYYKADILNVVNFTEFTALYETAPAPQIVADKTEVVTFSGKTETVNAFVAFARDKQISWTSENENVVTVNGGVITAKGLGKTNVVLSADGAESVKIPVSVVEGKDITPSYKENAEGYPQGMYMDLSAYDGFDGITFNMTFADENSYLTIIDGVPFVPWGYASTDRSSIIGPNTFKSIFRPDIEGFNYTISTDVLKIKDENGAYIDYTHGYTFKKDVKYAVEYQLPSNCGRRLTFWVANNDTHANYWGVGEYYSNPLEHVAITDVKGLWTSAPVFSAEISESTKAVSVGDEFTLTVAVKNAFGLTGAWSTDNNEVVSVTDSGVVTAKKLGVANVIYKIGGVELKCEVKVCDVKDITPSWGRYHQDYPQGAILDLSAYSGYNGITFDMSFAEDGTFLTVTQGKVIGWATGGIADYASVIGPATFKGVWAQTKMSDCIPVNVFRIKDENGAYIDYTQGYSFKAGVTYKVEYELTDEKHLSFWTANNAEHGIFWGINGYYTNALEHVTVSNVKGLWTGEPQIKVSLNVTEKGVTIGDEFTLTAAVVNAFGQSGVWATDNGEVASVTSDGLVKALSVGTANVSYTVGGVKAVCIVKVGGYKDLTASLKVANASYPQAMYLDLSEYDGYTAIKFSLTFADENSYLTIVDEHSFGNGGHFTADDYSSIIGPNTFKSVFSPKSDFNHTISTDIYKIKDENGEYIDYTHGYTFKKDVKYTVEYQISSDSGRHLTFWVADNDTHDDYWGPSKYYSNPLEHISITDLKGLF